MKVLHLNQYIALKGGVETYLLNLIPLLTKAGITSVVGYAEGDPSLVPHSVHIPGLQTTGFQQTRQAKQSIRAQLEEISPDVIHIHNVQNLGALQASLEYGSTVITTHDYRWLCPANSFFYKSTGEVCPKAGAGPGCFLTTLTKHCLTPRPRYALYYYHRSRWAMNHADQLQHIIAPCHPARERLSAAGFPEDLITVLPYFCPLAPLDQPRPLPERPTITFLGRIAPNKGHEYFIEALGKLPGSFRGIMVGNIDSQNEKYLTDLARRNNCQDWLVLRKWASREEVKKIFDRTTVFIFPSLWQETLGIVGIEALSRGVPVVASNIGGPLEWLKHGENGLLVPPKSADEIREAVLDITASEERILSMGTAGIRSINEKFLPDRHVEKLGHIYETLVRREASVKH